MTGVHVDLDAQTVRAEGRVTWAELDRETQVFGLATPGGVVSTTGIAGLTLGGEVEWLRRKYGLTIDNLVSVDLVTTNGEFLTANERENTELFWESEEAVKTSGWSRPSSIGSTRSAPR